MRVCSDSHTNDGHWLLNFRTSHIWPVVFFLGGAPLNVISSVNQSVYLSVRPSVAHHISGTIRHLIIIFGTQMQNDIRWCFFYFFQNFDSPK